MQTFLDHSDARSTRPQERLVAILSALAVRLAPRVKEGAGPSGDGDVVPYELVAAVERHGGRVVECSQDGLAAEFPTALCAVACAIDVQRTLAAWRASEAQCGARALRIGVAHGTARIRGPVGRAGLRVAAHVGTLANPGGLCVSCDVYEEVKERVDAAFEPLGDHAVRRLGRVVTAYRCLLGTVLRVGELELDVDRLELRRAGVAVELQRKPLEVLAHLVRHRDRWVSKQELLDRLWPAVVVSEAALFSAVRDVRRALGDDGRRPVWVRSQRGRGFRFVGRPAAIPDVHDRGSLPPSVAARLPPLVGRLETMAHLEVALEETCRRHGRIVLLSGEAGIGKTRLAQEIARRAEQRGLRAVWGRGGGPGGAPLRPWYRIADAADGGSGADIAKLEGWSAPPPTAGGPDAWADARARFFDGIVRRLGAAADASPVVAVLDDLQDADPASLDLLLFLSARLDDTRLLVVATYRDAELAPCHVLRAILPKLLREEGVSHRTLEGLSVEETSQLVSQHLQRTPPRDVVAAIHERARGNPLFVEELLRESPEATPGEPVSQRPRGLGALLERRIEALEPSLRTFLGAASVLGEEIRPGILGRMLGTPEETIAALLERLASARLVERDVNGSTWRFRQPLVREAIYTGLTDARRRALHLSVGEALEQLRDDPGAEAATLAHHFAHAGPLGRERALTWSARAGRAALRAFAYDDAAVQLDRALSLQEHAAHQHAALRCELLLDLGDAFARGGSTAKARAPFQRAASLAHALRAPALVARSVERLESVRWVLQDAPSSSAIPGLEAALADLVDTEHALRASLLARLAFALASAADEAAETRAAEAIEAARQADDGDALAFALGARHYSLWRPERLAEREALAREMAARARDPALAHLGHEWSFLDALRRADLRSVRESIAATRLIARVHRVPWRNARLALSEGTLACLQGRFDEAERAVFAGFEAAERLQSGNLRNGALALLFGVRRLQGRLAELPLGNFDVGGDFRELVQAAQLLVAADTGRRDEVRAELARSAAEGFPPGDGGNEALRLGLLADACARVGDRDAAIVLEQRLRAWLPQHLVGVGGAYLGSSAHWIGLLADLAGRADEAVALLRQALASYRDLEAAPWIASTLAALAAVLGRRDGPGDCAEAAGMTDQASAAARRLGLERIAAALDGAPGLAPRGPRSNP